MDQRNTTVDDTRQAAAACVVCAEPTEQIDTCCSQSCAMDAEGEVRRNAVLLQRVSGWDAPAETRRRLAERNGRLSSALLRWRPDVVTAVAPAPDEADDADEIDLAG